SRGSPSQASCEYTLCAWMSPRRSRCPRTPSRSPASIVPGAQPEGTRIAGAASGLEQALSHRVARTKRRIQSSLHEGRAAEHHANGNAWIGANPITSGGAELDGRGHGGIVVVPPFAVTAGIEGHRLRL